VNDSTISPLSSSTGLPASSTAVQPAGSPDFDELLNSLVASPMSGLGGEDALSGVMSIFMLGLLEKMLDRLPEASAATTGAPSFQHINQFDAERTNGGDGRNADCGPAALLMALRAVGLNITGATTGMNDGQAIQLARLSMVADLNRDGVDGLGRPVEHERNTFTNLTEVQRGAQASGAATQPLAPNAEAIRQAVLRGASVVVLGTFAGKSPLPWTGDRGHDNASAPGGATGHFVTVTAYDPNSGAFLVHDPARRTPLAVTGPTLEHFMRGNAGALAVRR
jgi:hypothetical protein